MQLHSLDHSVNPYGRNATTSWVYLVSCFKVESSHLQTIVGLPAEEGVYTKHKLYQRSSADAVLS